MKPNATFFFFLITISFFTEIKAQLILESGPIFPPKIYDCDNQPAPNVTLLAMGGFLEAPLNPDGSRTVCINLTDYGIDPLEISEDIELSVFFDIRFESVQFSTSEGASQAGTVGNKFAYAVIPADESEILCADVTMKGTAANGDIEVVAFFVSIVHGESSNSGVSSISFIDNELHFEDDPDALAECEIGTMPIVAGGDGSQVMDVNIEFTMSEVELDDPRTADIKLTACGITYDMEIDPEPLPGVPGVATWSAVLNNVPTDCTELSYEFCAERKIFNDNERHSQSFGIGGMVVTTDCFTGGTCELNPITPNSVSCRGNGTDTDATDDYIRVRLNPTGMNLGNSYNISSNSGSISPVSANYGSTTTFNLSAGTAGGGNIILTITDIDNPSCTQTVSITDPGSCSTGCMINTPTATNIDCDDNGTGTDSSDDIITFDLNLSGAGISTTYNLSTSSGSISPTSASYGSNTSFTLNAGSAGNGDVIITITDTGSPSCTEELMITDPGSCSNDCMLNTINPIGIRCEDNGTTNDDTDDVIAFNLNPDGLHLGTNYTVSVSSGTISPTTATYGSSTKFTLDVGSAGGGDISVTITDDSDATCSQTITITDPGNCSDGCLLENVYVTGLICNNNNTKEDSTDDFISFSLNPEGTGIGATYNVSVSGGSIIPTSANYGISTDFQLQTGSAGGGDITVTITDATDASCSINTTITDPGSCSVPCIITDVEISRWCTSSGTPFDNIDDYTQGRFTVNGTGVSTFYNVSISPSDLVRLDETDMTTSPFTEGVFGSRSGIWSFSNNGLTKDDSIYISIVDANDATCTLDTFTRIRECRECEISDWNMTLPECNDNGTPTIPDDDYITFSIEPEGTNLFNIYRISLVGGSDSDIIRINAQTSNINSVSYDSIAYFRLYDGSADGVTNHQIAIADRDLFCRDTIEISALLNPIITELNDETICLGGSFDSANVTTSVTNGVSTSYQWYNDNGPDNNDALAIAGQTTATLTALPTTVGVYQYRVVATSTSNNSCAAEKVVTLSILAPPTAIATITPSACTPGVNNAGTITISNFNIGERYALEANSNYTGSATFASGSTAIPTDGIIVNNLINPSGSQQYTVRLFNSSECFTDISLRLSEISCIDYPDFDRPDNPCVESPCHIISNELYLGNGITPDSINLSASDANMDNDDGVSILPNMQFVAGNTVHISVFIFNNTGIDAHLRMWIDWNGDGDFEEADEQIANNIYPSTGAIDTVFVSVTIPITAVQSQDIALRARLSTDDTNSSDPCGNGNCAADGEIEDYLIRIDCPRPICTPVQLQIRSGN